MGASVHCAAHLSLAACRQQSCLDDWVKVPPRSGREKVQSCKLLLMRAALLRMPSFVAAVQRDVRACVAWQAGGGVSCWRQSKCWPDCCGLDERLQHLTEALLCMSVVTGGLVTPGCHLRCSSSCWPRQSCWGEFAGWVLRLLLSPELSWRTVCVCVCVWLQIMQV